MTPADPATRAVLYPTVVFTDIIDSSEMYERAGDVRAYQIVRDHFDALRAVIAVHHGTTVKTMGDAVMAVFRDPRDAVAAALCFGDAVAPLRLRVGMHRGPCIAATRNGDVDYFGATVNVASRVAHAGRSAEVMITSAVADDPRVAEILPRGERSALRMRGFEETIEVLRVATPRAPLAPAAAAA